MVSSSARVVSLIALYLRAPISANENLKEGSCFMLLILFSLVSGEKCGEKIT